MKKKQVNSPIEHDETDLRTVEDYEILRHCIVEDGKSPSDGAEYDLAGLITKGVAVWLYQKKGLQDILYTKQFKPQKKQPAEDMTVLLANMMES